MCGRLLFFVLAIGLYGAVAAEEGRHIPEPAVLTAIRDEDPEQYSQAMRHLLTQRNMKEFLDVLLFRDAKGNSIFHLMAGVQNEPARAFFAVEMQALHDLLIGNLKPGNAFILGGTEISIPGFSKIPISSAFREEWENSVFVEVFTLKGQQTSTMRDIFPSVNLPLLAREMERLQAGPVIELVMALHAENWLGRPFLKDFLDGIQDPKTSGKLMETLTNKIKDHSLRGLLAFVSFNKQGDISMSDLLEKLREKGGRFIEQIEKISKNKGIVWLAEDLSQINRENLKYLLQATNSKGHRPTDTALYTQNTQAYDFLKTLVAPSRSDPHTPFIAGLAGAFYGLTGYEIYRLLERPPFSQIWGVDEGMTALGSGLGAGLTAYLCKRAVKGRRIRRIENSPLKAREGKAKVLDQS